MAEALYYVRIPVNKFMDIGTGPGYFLDAVEKYLPGSKEIFYGTEKFPPEDRYRTQSPNYILTGYDSLQFKIDCGICIEVLEHLTPNMFEGILKDLAKVSNEQAFYIFNTGMPEFVLKEDPNYLDPIKRGHIFSYSIEGVNCVAEKWGFTAFELPGETWAFALEYKSKSKAGTSIQSRIWCPLEQNMAILKDRKMGSVLKVLGLESARAYYGEYLLKVMKHQQDNLKEGQMIIESLQKDLDERQMIIEKLQREVEEQQKIINELNNKWYNRLKLWVNKKLGV